MDDKVELWLEQTRMTWRQWEGALKVVGDFYVLWTPVMLVFEVMEIGSGVPLVKGNVTQNTIHPSS